MESWLISIIMGIVEGLTEFLPVSSTGHLILAGSLMGMKGEKAATFEIAIQLGAILAVVVLYRQRFIGLLKHNPRVRFSGLKGIALLMLTSFPAALLGLFTHKFIKTNLFTPHTVAIGFAAGGLAILAVEAWGKKPRYSTLDEISPLLALGVGLSQCLSLWPGFSRSGATIMGGMLFGADRKLAAEYSFIAAVPIMFVATAYDVWKSRALLGAGDMEFFAIGFLVSFISAIAAVKAFTALLSTITLKPFAWYRLAVAPLVYFFWPK